MANQVMQNPRDIIFRRLESQIELPMLPDVVLQLERVGANQNVTAKDIAEIVEKDGPMSAKLVRLANSSFYRHTGGEVSSLRHAVARLGIKEVRKVCLVVGAMRLFPRNLQHVDTKAFWHHSVTVGCATRIISQISDRHDLDPDEAFVAGLLHDVGSVLLDQHFEKLYGIVFREADRTQRSIHLIEQEYLKTNHAEVGAFLLERWKLPTRLVNAVRHHHEPSTAPEDWRTLCQLVHLADFACTKQGIGGPGEQFLSVVSGKAWRDLGLRVDDISILLSEIVSESDRGRVFTTIAL